MSVKKSAYQYTTPEQAPLFMCAGEENAGKVPKVDRNGYITEFVEIGGSGEPDEYIKDITKDHDTFTATKKDGTTVDWTIPDVSLLAPKANAELTGTTQAENLVVSGDISAKSGTAVTDFDMSNAKTFIIPHITLIDPAEATSGTLTDIQLATLQSTDNAYILFNGEKYYLNDKEHTTGSLGYDCCSYENSKFTLKSITVTISTKGWVLNTKELEDGGASIISKTYAELKAMRDGGTLVAGQYYRITDYVATTTQTDTQSANHPFDLIVVAIANNKLSEEATAIQHSGDTYFANSNLTSWDVWYCLDNDTNRFAWADSANGKGVIYYLKDEFSNSCWYDWKGIQVKNTNSSDRFYYLFDNSGVDASLSSSTSFPSVYGNKLGFYVTDNKFRIGCNVFKGNYFYSNTIGNDFYNNTIENYFYSNTIGNNFYSNTIGNSFNSNTIGNSFNNNTIGNNFLQNTIGNNFNSNTIGNSFNSNTIGDLFNSNTIGNSFNSNTIGNSFSNNTIGTSTTDIYYQYNNFGNGIKYVDITDYGTSSTRKSGITIPSGYAGTSATRKTLSSVNNNTTYYLNTAQLS